MRIPAKALFDLGHSICSLAPFEVGISVESAEELCAFSDVLVFPSPVSKDTRTVWGTSIPFSSLPITERHAVFGGFFPKNFQVCARAVFDCALDESFLLKNAALTADGGIAAALSATERGLYGCSVGVIGYGRIAKMLCRRLSGFGVPVTVYARRPEALSDAALAGYRAAILGENTVFEESVLFNTVPDAVFGGTRVSRPLCIFDLGGGLPAFLLGDGDESFPVTSMRGVPGVFAPRAAGEIILDALLFFLKTL